MTTAAPTHLDNVTMAPLDLQDGKINMEDHSCSMEDPSCTTSGPADDDNNTRPTSPEDSQAFHELKKFWQTKQQQPKIIIAAGKLINKEDQISTRSMRYPIKATSILRGTAADDTSNKKDSGSLKPDPAPPPEIGKAAPSPPRGHVKASLSRASSNCSSYDDDHDPAAPTVAEAEAQAQAHAGDKQNLGSIFRESVRGTEDREDDIGNDDTTDQDTETSLDLQVKVEEEDGSQYEDCVEVSPSTDKETGEEMDGSIQLGGFTVSRRVSMEEEEIIFGTSTGTCSTSGYDSSDLIQAFHESLATESELLQAYHDSLISENGLLYIDPDEEQHQQQQRGSSRGLNQHGEEEDKIPGNNRESNFTIQEEEDELMPPPGPTTKDIRDSRAATQKQGDRPTIDAAGAWCEDDHQEGAEDDHNQEATAAVGLSAKPVASLSKGRLPISCFPQDDVDGESNPSSSVEFAEEEADVEAQCYPDSSEEWQLSSKFRRSTNHPRRFTTTPIIAPTGTTNSCSEAFSNSAFASSIWSEDLEPDNNNNNNHQNRDQDRPALTHSYSTYRISASSYRPTRYISRAEEFDLAAAEEEYKQQERSRRRLVFSTMVGLLVVGITGALLLYYYTGIGQSG